MDYLELLEVQFPALKCQISDVREALQRALWHELTLNVESLIQLLKSIDEAVLPPLFEKVVLPVSKKLNPIALVRIQISCLKSLTDPAQARKSLSSVASYLKSANMEAYVFLRCEDSCWAVHQNNTKEAEEILEDCKQFILSHEAQDINQEVHSAFYASESKNFKSIGKYNELYSSGLLYLAYADIEKLASEAQQKWAVDIGLAALLGEKVYNFGELLGNPVMKALSSSKYEPLYALLNAFKKGDIPSFERLFTQEPVFKEFSELQGKAAFLQEKMQLMAFLNYVFSLAIQNMVVPFQVVAEKARVKAEMVEYMILKALALGLIKGVIDEVAQSICISWVQARVLEREEMKAVVQKLSSWSNNVRLTLDLVSATNSNLQALQ